MALVIAHIQEAIIDFAVSNWRGDAALFVVPAQEITGVPGDQPANRRVLTKNAQSGIAILR
jgi:hypothetical protein